MHTTTLEEKVRVGCAATSDDFKQRLSSGLFNAATDGGCQSHTKSEGLGNSRQSTVSLRPYVEEASSGEEASGDESHQTSMLKRKPSAHGARKPAAMKGSNTGVTDDLKKKHDQEQEAQNEQLNKCLKKALS